MAILIVEDNAVNAKLLGLQLKGDGYHSVVARGGAEALTILSGTDPIELIITDFMMPDMNGLELIATIKTMPACNTIPIIIISAYSDLQAVTEAKALGCQDFLTKPIEKTLLIKRVEHLLKSFAPVLGDKSYVLAKLNIEPAHYDELVRQFAAQLTDTLPAVVLAQPDSDETVSKRLGYLLEEVAESAAILGADKFLRLYEQSKGRILPSAAQCRELLAALQELDAAVTARVLSLPQV